jgi:hypothetical protein
MIRMIVHSNPLMRSTPFPTLRIAVRLRGSRQEGRLANRLGRRRKVLHVADAHRSRTVHDRAVRPQRWPIGRRLLDRARDAMPEVVAGALLRTDMARATRPALARGGRSPPRSSGLADGGSQRSSRAGHPVGAPASAFEGAGLTQALLRASHRPGVETRCSSPAEHLSGVGARSPSSKSMSTRFSLSKSLLLHRFYSALATVATESGIK